MSKTKILFIVGVFIALLPYLGFPYFWKNVLFTLSGLGIAFFAYMLNRESKKIEKEEKTFDNFRENSNFKENETKKASPVDELQPKEEYKLE